MDGTGTALVVGLAALAGLLLLLAGVAFSASSRRSGPGPAGLRPAAGFADDDLPRFLAAPPGTPGTRPCSGAAAPRPRRRGTWVLAGTAGVVLLVAGAVAAVVRVDPGTAAATPSAAASSAPPSPPPPPGAPAPPSPGDPGAGQLAGAELPLGPGDLTARLAAGGLVLVRVPAGVVAGFPRVTLSSAGDHAVVHLELPVADCLTPTAPVRPEDAGCLPTVTEHADLGTPALQVSRAAGRLTLSGRFPTYLRPDGAPPVWTGRSRDVTVTVELPPPSGDGPQATGGSVTVDGATSATLPDPALTTVTYGR